jgi:predicted O-methyltransferase YrrM
MDDILERLQAAGPPLQTDAWSLGDEPLRLVLAEIDAGARTIVECGCGRSTVIAARRLRELGAGSLHALEHDPSWAERTRAALTAEDLDGPVVIDAPLEPHPLAGAGGGWYAISALSALPSEIDLLLIDGPPAGDPELRRNRHPALAELGPKLSDGATIVLDDARRAGEREAVALWQTQYPVHFEMQGESGAATARWQVYVEPSGDAQDASRMTRFD